MLRHIATLALCILALTCAAQESAGLTAGQCLAKAPNRVFSLIDTNTRLDMLDYFRAGVDRSSHNAVGGECQLLSETDYSVTLKGGDGIEYQIFVLNPQDPYPIIGIIETIETPIRDSKVTFYNKNWVELQLPLFSEPTLSDWMLKKGSLAEAEEQLPFLLTSYAYDPDSQQLVLTNNMASYYHPDEVPSAISQMAESLAYKWSGKTFKLKK